MLLNQARGRRATQNLAVVWNQMEGQRAAMSILRKFFKVSQVGKQEAELQSEHLERLRFLDSHKQNQYRLM
jgi:hypothetical protein